MNAPGDSFTPSVVLWISKVTHWGVPLSTTSNAQLSRCTAMNGPETLAEGDDRSLTGKPQAALDFPSNSAESTRWNSISINHKMASSQSGLCDFNATLPKTNVELRTNSQSTFQRAIQHEKKITNLFNIVFMRSYLFAFFHFMPTNTQTWRSSVVSCFTNGLVDVSIEWKPTQRSFRPFTQWPFRVDAVRWLMELRQCRLDGLSSVRWRCWRGSLALFAGTQTGCVVFCTSDRLWSHVISVFISKSEILYVILIYRGSAGQITISCLNRSLSRERWQIHEFPSESGGSSLGRGAMNEISRFVFLLHLEFSSSSLRASKSAP